MPPDTPRFLRLWCSVVSKTVRIFPRSAPASTVDKIAYEASNFVTPAPSFSAAARLLAGQAYKGVKDNVDYYRGSGSGRGRGKRKKGGAVDIHKAIGKLPKPKGGWTLPGHKYTGPYNDLYNQVKYDPVTGKILESMTHLLARLTPCNMRLTMLSVKMIKNANIPWNERQWGHWLTRNIINTKRKVGLGNPKGVKQVKQKRPKMNLG